MEEKNNKTEDVSRNNFWRNIWNLLKPFKKLFQGIVIITIASALLDLALPYILKLLVDGLNSFGVDDLILLIKLIVLYLFSGQASYYLNYLSNRRVLRLLVEIEYYLNVKAQKKLVELDLGYHEKENTGSKIIKIERGVDKVSRFLESVCYEVIPTLFQITLTLGALFWTDWRIGLSFLFFTPIYLAITFWANKRMYPIRKEIFRDYEKSSGKMGQTIININAVQSFVQEERELNEFDKIKTHIRENEDKQWGWMMRTSLWRNWVINFGRATVLFLGVYLVYRGVMTVGSLIFAFTLSEKAYSSLSRLSRFYDRMEEGREGVNRLMDLFNKETAVINKENGIKPKNVLGDIKFKNVSFFYPDSSIPAVNDVTFDIPAGSTTALVGPSGGGKTTIARLVYRHYDPQSGTVFLDDHDLRDYDIKSFRKFLAIVPQEVEIFDLSIHDNIAYANPGASFAEIEAAAKIANAEEFIKKLEKGYETMVGERGLKLSGGQRQRIGIARAILANPRVLIFDEATSNLDSQSEFLIQDAMQKISQNRTMIVIAHRLSTIKKADKIVVFENGRAVEEGSHLELSKVSGGLYAKLLSLQKMGDVN